ncbi:MAG: hypothetical protein IPM91_14765 [Bacteroidetes bacterium]|nr:hypothetical protein [Bacteroidota bacterium]
MYKGSYEINAIYDEKKHNLFYPFNKGNIINTNLQLTWLFFYYTIAPFLDSQFDLPDGFKYDEMWICSFSGTALYNLQSEAENDDYLKTLNDSVKKVKLLYSIQNPQIFEKKDKEHKNPLPLIDILKSNLNNLEFKCANLKREINIHQMALYFKNNKPIKGIYFFKPTNKVRINPVFLI